MSHEVSGETCTFIFKKRSRRTTAVRKRQLSDSEDGSDNDESQIVTKTNRHKKKINPNIQSTSKIQKKEKLSNNGTSSSDDNDDILINFKSNKSAMPKGPSDQGATATVEIDTEKDRDAQAIFEKRLKINKQLEGKEDDKVYRGLNNYTQYYKPKDTAAGNSSSGLVRKGPIRAPTNLRATVRWDYQPDICKDYKETGFCGFGDSCKFLHDRSDYKHGWQLEREEKFAADRELEDDDSKYEIHSDEEELPFKCVLCRGSFVNPVISKCKHYFCEKCALDHFKKTTRCFVCSAPITTLKPANNLIAKLNAIHQEEEKRNTDDSLE